MIVDKANSSSKTPIEPMTGPGLKRSDKNETAVRPMDGATLMIEPNTPTTLPWMSTETSSLRIVLISNVENENMKPITRMIGMAIAAEVTNDNRRYRGPRHSSPVIIRKPLFFNLEPSSKISPDPII